MIESGLSRRGPRRAGEAASARARRADARRVTSRLDLGAVRARSSPSPCSPSSRSPGCCTASIRRAHEVERGRDRPGHGARRPRLDQRLCAPDAPALDALARDGTNFSQAITVAPQTWQSYSSILSGLYPPTTACASSSTARWSPDIADARHGAESERVCDGDLRRQLFMKGMTGGNGFDDNIRVDTKRVADTSPDAQVVLMDQIMEWIDGRKPSRSSPSSATSAATGRTRRMRGRRSSTRATGTTTASTRATTASSSGSRATG